MDGHPQISAPMFAETVLGYISNKRWQEGQGRISSGEGNSRIRKVSNPPYSLAVLSAHALWCTEMHGLCVLLIPHVHV